MGHHHQYSTILVVALMSADMGHHAPKFENNK